MRGRIPTREQDLLIAKAGLNPAEWTVLYENDRWLALSSNGQEELREARIDLDTMDVKTSRYSKRRRDAGKRKMKA